jgi:hypothetical protein
MRRSAAPGTRARPGPIARRAVLVAVGLALPLAVASQARAQGVDDLGAYSTRDRRARTESPQHAAFELRIGRYRPNVDHEFLNVAPYDQTFGSKNHYSVGFEIDWQALRIPFVGTLGPGVGLGYTKMTAASFLTRDMTRAGEDSSLTIFPFYAVAVLRADVVARETPIPLVPYAKLGVGAAIWTVGSGNGTASANGVKGTGLSYGPQFALGGMFLLDALDPNAAKEMDNDVGINNSYFFMEWYASNLDGFGSGKQMQVGTSTWALGLAFEM